MKPLDFSSIKPSLREILSYSFSLAIILCSVTIACTGLGVSLYFGNIHVTETMISLLVFGYLWFMSYIIKKVSTPGGKKGMIDHFLDLLTEGRVGRLFVLFIPATIILIHACFFFPGKEYSINGKVYGTPKFAVPLFDQIEKIQKD